MEKTFTKADLKTGMTVTLRNGDDYVVLKDYEFKSKDDGVGGIFSSKGAYIRLESYSDNLKIYNSYYAFDIMKIFIPQNNSCFFTERTLVWERKEVRKITSEEAVKIIKDKCGEDVEISL